MRHRLSTSAVRLTVLALCVMMIGSWTSTASLALPEAPGVAPDRVGQYEDARLVCDLGGVPMPNWLLDIITFFQSSNCHEGLDHLQDAYVNAYHRAESEIGSPGYPTNDVHPWAGVLVQDFSGGQVGDGWGAIVSKSRDDGLPAQQAHFVAGSTWKAYVYAVNNASVLGDGIRPGYPTGLQHQWNRVIIQDFAGGSWGITAIIGGDQPTAWVVAGNHLQAYIDADGSNTLRNPLGPVVLVGGKYVQEFEGGKILELAGETEVEYYTEADTPPELPAVGHQEPTQPPIQSVDEQPAPQEQAPSVGQEPAPEQPMSPPIQQIEPDGSQDVATGSEQPSQENEPIGESESPPTDNSGQSTNQVDTPSEDESTCSNPKLPELSILAAYGDGTHNISDVVQVTFFVDNYGCRDYGIVDVRLVDEAPDGQSHILYEDTLELRPGLGAGAGVNVYLDQAGEHKLWIEWDDGTGWQRIVNNPDRQDPTLEMPDIGDRHVNGYLYITVADSSSAGSGAIAGFNDTIISDYTGEVVDGFTENCSYSWSFNRSVFGEHSCGNQPPDLTGPQLDYPPYDGCAYYFNGQTFQLSPAYVCGQN